MSTVIFGIDPGSTECGWAMVDVSGARQTCAISYLDKGTVDSTEDAFVHLFDEELSIPPDIIAIESITPPGDEKAGFMFGASGQFTVRHLLLTNKVTGELLVVARKRARIVEMTAGSVRKLTVGKHNAKDNVVKAGVDRYVRGLPRTTNVHTRDALLLCVAVAWKTTGER